MKKTDELIEIYKTFVSTITATENRRQRASNGHLAMMLAVATFANELSDSVATAIVVIVVISLMWLCAIKYFRMLAKAKFRVIEELEGELPFAAFKTEDTAMKENKNWIMRVGLTRLEMAMPIVVAVICVVVLLLA